jgi:hypothetical protein
VGSDDSSKLLTSAKNRDPKPLAAQESEPERPETQGQGSELERPQLVAQELESERPVAVQQELMAMASGAIPNWVRMQARTTPSAEGRGRLARP